MPTYTYECEVCGSQESHTYPITSKPDTLACSCGGVCAKIINWQGSAIVRGQQYAFSANPLNLPIGWERGNSNGKKQLRRYQKKLAEDRAFVREHGQAQAKVGWKRIASVPRELHRERSRQFGQEYLDPTCQTAGELRQKLKADDMLLDS